MNGSFAFGLPVTMLGFACGFLLLWRWGARPGLAWSIGFLAGALGFGSTVLSLAIPDTFLAIFADIVFVLSFFCYGQGLLQRIQRNDGLRARIGLVLLGAGLSVWSVLGLGNLHVELVTNELVCVALIGLPLVYMGYRRLSRLDRILFLVSLAVVVDCLVRVALVFMMAPGRVEDFADTEYAFAMQATGSVLVVAFALTAMAALALDLLVRYRQEASTDPLSGLLNRRGFEDRVAACRAPSELAGSIITCDIDHFKQVNDRFGHAAGDVVIGSLAAIIRACLPENAIAARFGGEEFVIYLPHAPLIEARQMAEQIRLQVAGRDWAGAGIDLPVTASFGLSGRLPSDFSLHDGIARADEALYEAKRAGRNQVAVKLTLLPPGAPTGPATQLRG